MAGDWIKWHKGLEGKAEVVRLSGMLKLPREVVATKLMTFWCWCDNEIPQEDIRDNGSAFVTLSPCDGDNMAFIDALVGTPTFAASLAAVEWIRFRDGRVELPNFGRHNGETAKTRARNAKTQKKKRLKVSPEKQSETEPVQPHATPKVTEMSPSRGDKTMTREEERREDSPSERSNTPIPPRGFKPDFAQFYASYPRPSGKEAAAKAYERAQQRLQAQRIQDRGEVAAYLLERVTAFAKSPKGMGEFVPHPSTWLNQGRYLDDDSEWERAGTTQRRIVAGDGQITAGDAERF